MKQRTLTVLTPIRAEHSDALIAHLDSIGRSVDSQPTLPFHKVSSLHFARWAVLPGVPAARGEAFPPQLLFSVNYDGDLRAHLHELLGHCRSGVDAIYRHCVGYPAAASPSNADAVQYFIDNATDFSTFYVGAPGVTRCRVEDESALRTRLQKFLDASRHARSGTAREVHEAVRNHVNHTEDLQWALEGMPPPPERMPWHAWVTVALLALLASPLLALALLLTRYQELREPEAQLPPARSALVLQSQVRTVTVREDVQIQNQLTHVVELKEGPIRAIVLRLVLAVLDFGAHRVYNQGSLFGVSTLHFVRWILIDDGRRLLFLTDYDGSLDGYIADFINKSWQIPAALTAIWSNARGFPTTRWLMLEGARDVPRFTDFLRRHQVTTQVWYSAYKRITTGNIINNEQLRRGLLEPLDEAAAMRWCRRL